MTIKINVFKCNEDIEGMEEEIREYEKNEGKKSPFYSFENEVRDNG